MSRSHWRHLERILSVNSISCRGNCVGINIGATCWGQTFTHRLEKKLARCVSSGKEWITRWKNIFLGCFLLSRQISRRLSTYNPNLPLKIIKFQQLFGKLLCVCFFITQDIHPWSHISLSIVNNGTTIRIMWLNSMEKYKFGFNCKRSGSFMSKVTVVHGHIFSFYLIMNLTWR